MSEDTIRRIAEVRARRQQAFNLSRRINEIVNERDHLRELTCLLRQILADLARCVVNTESTLNEKLDFTLNCDQNSISIQSPSQTNDSGGESKDLSISIVFTDDAGIQFPLYASSLGVDPKSTVAMQELKKCIIILPNVHQLLKVIDDDNLVRFIQRNGEGKATDDSEENAKNFVPSLEELQDMEIDGIDQLLDLINNSNTSSTSSTHLSHCINKLRDEAEHLLKLSQQLAERRKDEEQSESEEEEEKEEEGEKKNEGDGDEWMHRLHKLELERKELMEENSRKQQELHHLQGELDESQAMNAYLKKDIFDLRRRVQRLSTEKKVNERQTGNDRSEEDSIQGRAALQQQQQQHPVHHQNEHENYEYLTTNGSDDIEVNSLNDGIPMDFEKSLEKARKIIMMTLSQSPKEEKDDDCSSAKQSKLLRIIEEMCRQGEQALETEKREKDDLRAQVSREWS